MNFKDQVSALTGLTISNTGTNPTEAQVSQYLTDGAKDIINKIIKIAPDEMFKFTTTSTDVDGTGVTVSGKVLSVVRESGTTIRPCAPINSAHRYLATEEGSMAYRSSYNPAWYELEGKVYAIPTPADGDDALITHVAYPTVAYGDSSIGVSGNKQTDITVSIANLAVFTKTSHGFSNGDTVKCYGFTQMTELNGITSQVTEVGGSSFKLEGIDSTNYGAAETSVDPDLGGTVERESVSFPDEYEYLVAIYAGMQALFNKMSTISAPTGPTDHSDWDDGTFSIDAYLGDEEEELASIMVNKLAAYVNAHQSEVMGDKSEYEWLQYRHNFLAQIYNAAFGAMAPQQQQQQAQA